MDRLQQLALSSIVIGIAVLGLKFLAFYLTGSVALYSDALESIINVATAVTAFFAVRLSGVPPDANHPYGHYKVEYLSAVLEGVLVVIASVEIFREAYLSFLAPKTLDAPFEGLAINAAASVMNAIWCLTLFRYGRRWRSPALVADAQHLFTDVITSVGVIGGVAAVALTGWLLLDPILAGLVAINILWSGWRLIRVSVGGLMDEAAPEKELSRIRTVISQTAAGALEAHDLRTRRAGRMTFMEFHLVVPGAMSVAESHDICDRIEAALKDGDPDTLVTIHVEPEDKAKQLPGVPVL